MHSYDITVKVAETHRAQLMAAASAERLARASRSSGTPAPGRSRAPRRQRGFVAWWRAGSLAPQV
jgi:hypothetical protein